MDVLSRQGNRPPSVLLRFPLYGFGLALLAVMVIMLAGLGSRWDWWHFRMGFTILKWGVYTGITAALFSLIGLVTAAVRRARPEILLGGVGLTISLLTIGVPWSWLQTARSVPPIHDITTDTEDPPQFVAILPLRKDAPNSAGYGGPEIAEQQRKGYPELGPKKLPIPPETAFEHALVVARQMGWEIVDANLSEGRIQATDTTFWFGFKDDVIVRITPADGGSKVDMRSVSRVGKSDVGTNAKRVSEFLKKIAP